MTLYDKRTYRNLVDSEGLHSFRIRVRETDLFIRADKDLAAVAEKSVFKYRGFIESYLKRNAPFVSSLVPLADDPFAPPVVRDMLLAGRRAGVGPMAAVAGAIAQRVGTDLLAQSENVIVENGGDIFIAAGKDKTVGVAVFAGDSPLSYKVSLTIRGGETPLGVCTSSGTVGGSLSFGKADAVTVVSQSTAMADAAATAVCNLIKNKQDIEAAIEWAKNISGVKGVLAIVEDRMGAWGDIELG